MSATRVWNQLLHLFLIQSWLAPVSGCVQMITAASPAQPVYSLHISLVRRLPLVPFAAYYILKLSVGFVFLLVCAVDMCPAHHPWWIIHLQADERRAGEVRSAEVEWPWFLLAAGHLAIALVIIHASQMAFLWASVKRTGQGLSCQVLPGPKTAGRGVVGLWRRTLWVPRNVWSDRAETSHCRLAEIFCLIGGAHAAKKGFTRTSSQPESKKKQTPIWFSLLTSCSPSLCAPLLLSPPLFLASRQLRTPKQCAAYLLPFPPPPSTLCSTNLRGSGFFRSATKASDCTTFSMTQLLWCQL